MNQRIVQLALAVRDYDEALAFYIDKVGFELVEDKVMSDTKRWVVIKPKGEGTCCLLLAKAANDQQQKAVGNQTGGRVFLFLYTDDIKRDYANLMANDVKIVRELEEQPYGTVTVFEDLYGNLWDLIEPK